MRIAVTANGPGEVAGWLRPLLRALYRRQPDLEALVFLVPDDYATGFEAQIVRDAFPAARVFAPKEYLKFAFGARLENLPPRVDRRAVYRRRPLARGARSRAAEGPGRDL